MASRLQRMWMWAAMEKKIGRKPPSGELIELHNPGAKLCLYLGKPIKTRQYNSEEHQRWPAAALLDSEAGKDGYCSVCTFDLPTDWEYWEDDSHPHYTIVARQIGTDRFVAVTKQSGVPMSEVHH